MYRANRIVSWISLSSREKRKKEWKCCKTLLSMEMDWKKIDLYCFTFMLRFIFTFNRSVKMLSRVLNLWGMRINWRIRATCTLHPVLTYNMALGSAVLLLLTVCERVKKRKRALTVLWSGTVSLHLHDSHCCNTLQSFCILFSCTFLWWLCHL